MIRDLANLVCEAGHVHYSPTPDYWVGKACFKPYGNPLTVSGDLRIKVERCEAPLSIAGERQQPRTDEPLRDPDPSEAGLKSLSQTLNVPS